MGGTSLRLPWRPKCQATAWAVPQKHPKQLRPRQQTPQRATGVLVGGSGRQLATACGGSTTQVPPAPTAPTGTTPNVVVGPGGQMNGGLACSKMTSGAGSTVSNTATFETVQPAVSQTGSGDGTTGANPSAAGTAAATACPTVSGALAAPNCLPNAAAKEPYTVSLTGTGGVAYAAGVATSNGGLTEDGLL